MRVAVAGLVKRGKSTLVNALLSGDITPTGSEETTFNVVELGYGKTPSFQVRYKDGRTEEFTDIRLLHRFAARQANAASVLSGIDRIYVSYPNQLLMTFRLLDIPGLGSVFETDSLNAMERLGLSPQSVAAESLAVVDQADAVVYLFNRAIAVSDAEIVREFGGSALEHLSPVKAIGILSRVDDYWPPRRRSGEDFNPAYDPLDRAASIVDRYLTQTKAADIFYDIKPVIGKLAAGAATATEGDLGHLKILAKMDPEMLFRRLRDAQLFATRDFPDVPLDRSVRAELIRLLGAYGVYLATRLIAAGADGAELSAELFAHSGVGAVRDVIVSHFGNRADLIKLAAILADLDAERARLRPGLSAQAAEAMRQIGQILGQLRASEHGFRELDALHAYYQLRADRRRGAAHAELSSDQAQEFLRVTGEHGLSCADRLGCAGGASTGEMLQVAEARLGCWRQLAIDPTMDRAILPVVDFMTVAYELLWHHVHEAQRHLAFEEDRVTVPG